MNRTEVAMLIAEVSVYCPAQQFDDLAVRVWARDLEPFASELVTAAARELLGAPRDNTDRPRYLHLGDVISRAKSLARQATEKVEFPEPPPKAASPEAREEWSKDRVQARNTGNLEVFLRKWYGVTSLTAITAGDDK